MTTWMRRLLASFTAACAACGSAGERGEHLDMTARDSGRAAAPLVLYNAAAISRPMRAVLDSFAARTGVASFIRRCLASAVPQDRELI